MNAHARETYAKSLLMRQQASQMAQQPQLWEEDPTLYARPAVARIHTASQESLRSGGSWSGGGSRDDLPSASRGSRPAPLNQSSAGRDHSSPLRRSLIGVADVSTSFVVAETGDERALSRGGTALSYGTAPASSHIEHRHKNAAGDRIYATSILEPGPPPAPGAGAALPFPVLWQLKAQPGEELAGGLEPIGGETAIEDALAMARELRGLRKRGGGVAAQAADSTKKMENHANTVVRQVREARHRAARAVLQAKQRERLAGGKPRLLAHSHDPGADTRPVPKAGRRAPIPPGQQPKDVPPGPIQWDGQDAVLPSGPRAPVGHSIPLQYLELVRLEDQIEAGVGDGGGSGRALGASGPIVDQFNPLALAKPGMRYAGGGFAKSRSQKEHTEQDYVELLRVAEVLEALNAVEGAVLHEQPLGVTGSSGTIGGALAQPQELLSYEEYLASVLADASETSVGPDQSYQSIPVVTPAPMVAGPAASAAAAAVTAAGQEATATEAAQDLGGAEAAATVDGGDNGESLRGATSKGSLPPTI